MAARSGAAAAGTRRVVDILAVIAAFAFVFAPFFLYSPKTDRVIKC